MYIRILTLLILKFLNFLKSNLKPIKDDHKLHWFNCCKYKIDGHVYTIYRFYCRSWANFISLFALELFHSPCCLSESEQTSDRFLGFKLVTYHFLKSGLFLPLSVSVRMWWDFVPWWWWQFFSLWVIIFIMERVCVCVCVCVGVCVCVWCVCVCVCFHVSHPVQFKKCVFNSSRLL